MNHPYDKKTGDGKYYLVPIEHIDNAVEVYSEADLSEGPVYWKRNKAEKGHTDYGLEDHKALLIRIEPIVKESCADVLRDIVNNGFSVHNSERAKQALENGE